MTAPVPHPDPHAILTAADPPARPAVAERKASFWRKLGGGSLTISIPVHAAILAIGVIWVVAIIPPPPESERILTSAGGRGDDFAPPASRPLQPSAAMPRVIAEAPSIFALPRMDLPKLSALDLETTGALGGDNPGRGDGSPTLGNPTPFGIPAETTNLFLGSINPNAKTPWWNPLQRHPPLADRPARPRSLAPLIAALHFPSNRSH